jgi:hypothetical protein
VKTIPSLITHIFDSKTSLDLPAPSSSPHFKPKDYPNAKKMKLFYIDGIVVCVVNGEIDGMVMEVFKVAIGNAREFGKSVEKGLEISLLFSQGILVF